MKEKGDYVPPRYIPLRESEEADATEEEATTTPTSLEVAVSGETRDGPKQWSSGICACFDDIQSCTLLFSVLRTLILLQDPSCRAVCVCVFKGYWYYVHFLNSLGKKLVYVLLLVLDTSMLCYLQ